MTVAPRRGRLLVVSYRFPPDGSVGGLRWAGLGKYLARAGWEVHVLTAARGARAATPDHVVHECPRLVTLNDAYRWLAGSRRREAVPVLPAPPAPENFVELVRREVASLVSFPDESRGWTVRAALRARRLVRRLAPDFVVSSGPPHSAHVVAHLAVAGVGVPLIMDLRDPWANQSRAWQNHPIYGRRIARRLVRRLERTVLRSAAAVIANTTALQAALATGYPGRMIHWLPNGVDPERVRQIREEPFPGLAVAHAGTLYGGRDPRPVLEAFRALLQRRPELARAGSRIRLAGHIEAEQAAELADATSRLGMDGLVQVLGVLPRDEALSLLRRSGLVLVLAQDQELQVPGKLYESVYLGCRTLVVAERDSASAEEAKRLGAMCVEPSDVHGLEAALEQAWERDAGDRPQPHAAVLDYAGLADQFEAIVRDLPRRSV